VPALGSRSSVGCRSTLPAAWQTTSALTSQAESLGGSVAEIYADANEPSTASMATVIIARYIRSCTSRPLRLQDACAILLGGRRGLFVAADGSSQDLQDCITADSRAEVTVAR
jgi:hypothetical protein